MNAQRRKHIAALQLLIADLEPRIIELLNAVETVKERADNLVTEETDYKDAMPESMQDSEKGERASAAIEALEEVRDSWQEMMDVLENLDFSEMQDKLSTAQE